jgi:hypothetical protein
MIHTRKEIIQRINREFKRLDGLVAGLSAKDWTRPVARPEVKEPWTVKDALAHITHWKANVARSIRNQRRPPEERGLTTNEVNSIVYLRWRGRKPQEVLDWHRQVQADVLSALRAAPDEWFSARERSPLWPFDLDGHSAEHRFKDIERTLASKA